MKLGLDVGSTTIKCVLLNDNDEIVYSSYERHLSKIVEKTIELLTYIKDNYLHDHKCQLMISGSAGMGMAQCNDIDFSQEVFATKVACEKLNPETDVVIELGGEDAKILFISNHLEVRMNGSCAGGTGAFIDQMATLLNCDAAALDKLADEAKRSYTIASRCGVFAKTDIQPLLNQGALKEDIALSIFYAIVNQTIAGLAQGRPIKGNVLYLGGPLTFLKNLRKCFDKTLELEGKCPENSLYYVALGAAYSAANIYDLDDLIAKLQNYSNHTTFAYIEPLFKNEQEYQAFKKRHDQAKIEHADARSYKGKAYLGIDSGSTTLKCVVIDEEGKILIEDYRTNKGNPVELIKDFLLNLYTQYPNIEIVGSGCTGYGEDIVKHAFQIDEGLVETIAHLTSAKAFKKDVDFIIDIGGQDMKCFKIHNGTIDNIFLNEACSSGCGSFLQTFATNLGYDIETFAQKGLFAKMPVDLGSRCTVFMNSSVKQAQKDGASIDNISAGLSISIVKNAIYKVIRCASVEELGKNIVVQGGTFYNDAVLRAFEQELKVDVIRPNIAGLMGAYGAALYVKNKHYQTSTILKLPELLNFEHKVSSVNCGLCENHCQLTVNTFSGNRKYISGNRCERPITKKVKGDELNIYEQKRQLIKSYHTDEGSRNLTIGLPLGLNMYELLPFWNAFFASLGFKVITSDFSSRATYLKGQNSIPSDTVCFPAKLMHGHVEELIEKGADVIFYPCMSYNVSNKHADNNYNCPVVAYYPEVLSANMDSLKKIVFINDYVGIHKPIPFVHKMTNILKKYFSDIHHRDVFKASRKAYQAYQEHMEKIYAIGDKIVAQARSKQAPIIVLAGRPYHIDPEISHGIDQMIAGFGCAIVSEDYIAHCNPKAYRVKVLNQWTYHSRLYDACEYVVDQKDMNLVQLVSFGCGCDAITSDECRSLLEAKGKIYTQIKIDEISNLGSIKIRIRSLLEALKQEKEGEKHE